MKITDLLDKKSVAIGGSPSDKADAINQMVALMDARSIAATAANKGYLTGADKIDARIGE